MTGQHTPGPWRISQNVSRHVIAPQGGVVACAELTWDGPGSSSTADANARLIATVPDMFEALQAINISAVIIPGTNGREAAIDRAALDKVIAALRKATRESS